MQSDSRITAVPSRGVRRSFRLRLPAGANFFRRHRETLVPSDYGPAIQENVLFFDGDLNSQGCVIVGSREDAEYLLVGALSAEFSITYLTVHIRQKRLESLTVWQPDCPAEGEGEPLVFLTGGDWRELLKQYAEAVCRHQGLPLRRAPEAMRIGYCSWYYSYQNVTEAEFFDNLAGLCRHRESFPARVAQIDDGYQRHHGDWLTTGPGWPSSLGEIAAQIAGEGMTPGIWLMPLLASTASDLFRQHPDWFVRDRESGEVIRIPGWSPPPEDEWVCLDASREEVKRHLATLFERLYADGFRYFKLDGLGLAYPDGVRWDPTATGISALRTALKVIRQAVGDAMILNCGAPYLATVGLLEQARMSGDTGIRWKAAGVPGGGSPRQLEAWESLDPTLPGLFNALDQTLQLWWMYDRWFLADPDVVTVRDEKSFLSEGEARMSALAAVLTGVCFTSDHLEKMSAARRELLSRCAALRMTEVQPVDLSSPREVSLLRGLLRGEVAVAVLNWSDHPQSIDLGPYAAAGMAREWLHGGKLRCLSNVVVLPARDAVMVSWVGNDI